MAITINGSGTITGVSAGGLPDGSITADDLASTLDISGKTVTLPSDVSGITTGKLLQVVHSGDYTETYNSSPSNNTWQDTVVTASITPQSTTSRIFVMTTFGLFGYNTVSDYGISNRIKRTIGGTSIYPTNLSFHNPSGANYHATIYENNNEGSDTQHRIKTFQALDQTHSTSSQITYTLQVGAYNINQITLGGSYNSRWNMTLMEIEQ